MDQFNAELKRLKSIIKKEIDRDLMIYLECYFQNLTPDNSKYLVILNLKNFLQGIIYDPEIEITPSLIQKLHKIIDIILID